MTWFGFWMVDWGWLWLRFELKFSISFLGDFPMYFNRLERRLRVNKDELN